MGTIRDAFIGVNFDERYLILSTLGQGATSSVYKAHDERDNKNVAIKILHSHLSADENLVTRFRREAETAAILTHANIAAVHYYAISDQGHPYLVMDFVEGLSLQQLLAQDGWLPLSKAIPIFAQICAGLNAAHQKDVVHRDLKPGNIMMTPQADDKYLVRILDFGCAQIMPALGETVMKATQTGEMLGSLLYMSPEQCLDQDVDRRSDYYSFGCVLYETLTGKPPLAARTAFETMNKHMTEMPDSLAHVRPDLGFPKGVEKLIFKAMAKSPAKRYQNGTELLEALLKFADKGDALVIEQNQAETGTHFAAITKVPAQEKPNFRLVYVELAVIIAGGLIISLITHSLWFTGVAIIASSLVYILLKGEQKQITASYAALDKVRRSPHALIEELPKTQYLGPPVMIVATDHGQGERHEIVVYGAQKRDNHCISLEISIEGSAAPGALSTLKSRVNEGLSREIIVRPLEYQSYFWATFCDKVAYGKIKSGYPVNAVMVKRESTKDSLVIIGSHLSVVIKQPGQAI